MPSNDILIRGRYVIEGTNDDGSSANVIEDGAVLCRDGEIVQVGPYELVRKVARSPIEELGGDDFVVMPGLVNSHHHWGLTPFQRGSADTSLETAWALRMSAATADPYLDTLYGAFQMIESGVTTVQHIHAKVHGSREVVQHAAERVIQAYDDIGMRASYSYAVRDQNKFIYQDDHEFQQTLPPALQSSFSKYVGNWDLSLSDSLKLFEDLFSKYKQHRRIAVQLAPSNLHWCSDDALRALNDTATRYSVPMHMHLLETPYQREYAHRRTGGTAVAYLSKFDMLGPNMTLAHCVWVTEEDIDLIAETGTKVCHNASSNLRWQNGIAPLCEFIRRGIPVALGMDGGTIEDDHDMLHEMKLAYFLHRPPTMEDVSPSAAGILNMASQVGADTTPFGDRVGSLKAGRSADLVLVHLPTITYPYSDSINSIIDLVIKRASQRAIHTVMVDGQVIYKDGKHLRLNKDDTLAQLAEQMKAAERDNESVRRELAAGCYPKVKSFYDTYLTDFKPKPYYPIQSKS